MLDGEAKHLLATIASLLGGEPGLRVFLLQHRRNSIVATNKARLAEFQKGLPAKVCGADNLPAGVVSAYAGMREPIRGPKCPEPPSKPNIAACKWPPAYAWPPLYPAAKSAPSRVTQLKPGATR